MKYGEHCHKTSVFDASKKESEESFSLSAHALDRLRSLRLMGCAGGGTSTRFHCGYCCCLVAFGKSLAKYIGSGYRILQFNDELVVQAQRVDSCPYGLSDKEVVNLDFVYLPDLRDNSVF